MYHNKRLKATPAGVKNAGPTVTLQWCLIRLLLCSLAAPVVSGAGLSFNIKLPGGGGPGGGDPGGPPVMPPAPTENFCAFEPILCRPGTFHLLKFSPTGCPVDSCGVCSAANGHRPECRGADCPTLVAPARGCPASQFLNITLDAAGCSALACTPCTAELVGLRPGCRCAPPSKEPLVCPERQFVRHSNDSRGCPAEACTACTDATSDRAECRGTGTIGCTEANKPRCPGDRQAVKKPLGAACSWVCQPCPPSASPASCPAGKYRRDNPAANCQPWTCRDCDYQHRDLPACRPAPEASCPLLNWAIACATGQYRRVGVSLTRGCLSVECANCADASSIEAAANPSLSSDLPAECQRSCPEPLVLCGPGTTVEFGLDSTGCRTAVCRPCRDQETCGSRAACASGRQLNHDADDCRRDYFYLGKVTIDGCAASVCLPCPAGRDAARQPGCKQLPAACAASASVGSNPGLPNCTAGAQRVEQLVDATGCPRLACAECPSSRPACPVGTSESPRPTKWLQCQLYDCRQPDSAGGRQSDNALPPLIPLDANGCPAQRWQPSPIEYGTEVLKLDGVCKVRRYRTCSVPLVTCRRGELPVLKDGTCDYTCQQQNWTTGASACFPGEHYIIFLIDTNRAKSPFQIRFQVASFIARLAGQLNFGPRAVQIGALCYSGRVISLISPDECDTSDAFFRRLLLLRYDEDSATATGEAVAAAAELFKALQRPAAKRSVIVLTDSATNSGRSLQDAAALLPAGTATYFLSMSSVWDPVLRLEAENFVSEPGNLVELTSYYLLSTSGVQLLFPQCYRDCDASRNSLTVYQAFLRYLQDTVHSYEAWLYGVYTTIAHLQEGLETMQYQFESKQIRLELCSRIITHYKTTVQRLQEQLDSIQAIRTQAVNVVDYESSLAQVRQLEQRIEILTVKKSQLVTQLQSILVQISAGEDRLVVLRKEQVEKLAAEDTLITQMETRTTASWKLLQTLTQELLLKRMSASSVEAMVQEKETRIQDMLQLNVDLATRINTIKIKIADLKNSTNSTRVNTFVTAQESLASCQARAALEGFIPLLTVFAGTGARIQESIDALLHRATYSWMNNTEQPERQLYSSLLNFTVGTYSEVKLLFRNTAGQTRAYLTFRVSAFDLTDFFDSTNLIACFPWRLESVKEAFDLGWSLRNDRFPSLLFSILASASSAVAAPSAAAAAAQPDSQCAGRKGLLAVVTDKDGCEDLAGPYPRMRFSPSGQRVALSEMEEIDSMQLLAKPLPATESDPRWLPGLVASTQMPVTLSELLSNGMLTYPPEAAPAVLRPGLFYKSQLLRSRPAAFPLIRLRLTDSLGRVQQLVFNGTFERDRVVESTWTRGLLSAARLFTVDPPPFGFTIGDATPCEGLNATGVLYFNLDNRCKTVANAKTGWSVLMSPERDRQVPWSLAERAAFVEIFIRRQDTLASASGSSFA